MFFALLHNNVESVFFHYACRQDKYQQRPLAAERQVLCFSYCPPSVVEASSGNRNRTEQVHKIHRTSGVRESHPDCVTGSFRTLEKGNSVRSEVCSPESHSVCCLATGSHMDTRTKGIGPSPVLIIYETQETKIFDIWD